MTTPTLLPHRSYWEIVAEQVAGREGWAAAQGFNPQMVPIQHRAKVFPELAPKPKRRRSARRSPEPLALPMRKVERGKYETEDGAYRVETCGFDFYCSENGHPGCPGDQWHTGSGWMVTARNVHGHYDQVNWMNNPVTETMREAVAQLSIFLARGAAK